MGIYITHLSMYTDPLATPLAGKKWHATALLSLLSNEYATARPPDVTQNSIMTSLEEYDVSGIFAGYLEYTTDAILNSINVGASKGTKMKLLKVITTPFTSLIIKVRRSRKIFFVFNSVKKFMLYGLAIVKVCHIFIIAHLTIASMFPSYLVSSLHQIL